MKGEGWSSESWPMQKSHIFLPSVGTEGRPHRFLIQNSASMRSAEVILPADPE